MSRGEAPRMPLDARGGMPLDARGGRWGAGEEERVLVLAGCAIYEAVAEKWPADKLRVGDRGLREGMLLNLMRRPKRRRRGGRKPQAAQTGGDET